MNTVVSGFMEYTNKLTEMSRKGGIDKVTLETAAVLIAPFAPHLGEELWQQLGHEGSVFDNRWPEADKEAMKDDEVTIAVQINGKTKCTIEISADAQKEDVLAQAKGGAWRETFRKYCERDLCAGKNCQYCCKIIFQKIRRFE